MTKSIAEKKVLEYFRGVDEEDLPLLLGTLTPDCVFSVETHGVTLRGHAEITGMFERLWSRHKSVRHDQFHFVENATGDEVAVRFRVTNILPDDSVVRKSNCNFFTMQGGHNGAFSQIRVYMAGENTLDRKK